MKPGHHAPRSPDSHAATWRLLVDEPLAGAANMARDHALAAASAPGRHAVRFYRWQPATLSLGRNEPVTGAYRRFLRQRPDVGLVRRPTGGRAVLHDRELTYSVALPARACGGPRAAYRRINEALVAGLRGLGVDARLASARTALPPDAGPCFLQPAEGEVTVAGRKLVGSAQARMGDALLQHGSLLLVSDQAGLAREDAPMPGKPPIPGAGAPMPGMGRATPNGVPGPAEAPPVTLAELLGAAPSWDRLVDALAEGFSRVMGGAWARGSMTGREESLAARYEAMYLSREWTWRR